MTRKNDKESILNIPKTEYNEDGWETKKEYRELDFTNNFIFTEVMTDPELCKKLLEVILDVEIERIEYTEKEKTIEEKPDVKSVRLDVYVKDGKGTIYDVEMQVTNPQNLPMRSRYYQAQIDSSLLAKGENYKNLNKSFVIFICKEGVFGQGRPIYTFENRCVQNLELVLGDRTTKIFLNPKSKMDGISTELANFLRFLIDGIAVDEFTERLVKAVESVRKNPYLGVENMSFYASQWDAYDEGLDAGLSALVSTLKPLLKDFDKVYEAVIKNEIYADVSREKVLEYYDLKYKDIR